MLRKLQAWDYLLRLAQLGVCDQTILMVTMGTELVRLAMWLPDEHVRFIP